MWLSMQLNFPKRKTLSNGYDNTQSGAKLMHAQRLPARAGQIWLREAFQLYRKNAPLLTSSAMAYMLLSLVIGLLPIIGSFLLPLIQPMLVVLQANVCALVARDEKPAPATLLYKLTERRPTLLQLGGMHLCLGTALMLIAFLLAYLLGAPKDYTAVNADNLYTLLLPALLIMVPTFLLTWFSPLLVAWHDVPPLKALFFSLVAVWRNLRAFFVFFVNVMLFFVVLPVLLLTLLTLLLPAGSQVFSSVFSFLMLMIGSPILLASVFLSYRQIFAEPAGDAP